MADIWRPILLNAMCIEIYDWRLEPSFWTFTVSKSYATNYPKILEVKEGKCRPFPQLLMCCLQTWGEIQPCRISYEGGQMQPPVHSVLPEIRTKRAGNRECCWSCRHCSSVLVLCPCRSKIRWILNYWINSVFLVSICPVHVPVGCWHKGGEGTSWLKWHKYTIIYFLCRKSQCIILTQNVINFDYWRQCIFRTSTFTTVLFFSVQLHILTYCYDPM